MKKWMCMLLVCVFLLVGCGGQNDKADNDMKPNLEANLLYENTISPNENMWKMRRIWFITPSRCIKKQADFW